MSQRPHHRSYQVVSASEIFIHFTGVELSNAASVYTRGPRIHNDVCPKLYIAISTVFSVEGS